MLPTHEAIACFGAAFCWVQALCTEPIPSTTYTDLFQQQYCRHRAKRCRRHAAPVGSSRSMTYSAMSCSHTHERQPRTATLAQAINHQPTNSRAIRGACGELSSSSAGFLAARWRFKSCLKDSSGAAAGTAPSADAEHGLLDRPNSREVECEHLGMIVSAIKLDLGCLVFGRLA